MGARAIVAAFAADRSAGVLKLDSSIVDRPHLVQARHISRYGGVSMILEKGDQ